MDLTFRPLTDTTIFRTTHRRPNRFRSTYTDTLKLLNAELDHLNTTEAWLQVAVDAADLRRDGMLRAHVKARHPGVVLTAVTRNHGTLVYPCDRFEGRWSNDPPDWQINLRAIALGLRDLRRLEDYGIADRGQQYAGFRELGTGTAVAGEKMTPAQAASFLADAAEWDTALDPDDKPQVQAAYRDAAKLHHPDAGGNHATMAYIVAARDYLTQ